MKKSQTQHEMMALADFSRGRKFVRQGQAFLASPTDRAHYLDRGLAQDAFKQDNLMAKAPTPQRRRAQPAPAVVAPAAVVAPPAAQVAQAAPPVEAAESAAAPSMLMTTADVQDKPGA